MTGRSSGPCTEFRPTPPPVGGSVGRRSGEPAAEGEERNDRWIDSGNFGGLCPGLVRRCRLLAAATAVVLANPMAAETILRAAYRSYCGFGIHGAQLRFVGFPWLLHAAAALAMAATAAAPVFRPGLRRPGLEG